MTMKQTEIRERGCKPACHHFPAEVSSSSSFPPGYTYQSKFKLRGRKKEQTTREKEGVPHRGDRLHVAMSQPDGQSVIFLGIKIWSSCFHQKKGYELILLF